MVPHDILNEIDDKNDDQEAYNAQWQHRWNPVIVGFYESTTLKPDYVFKKGDTIDWCAAFLNWCLARAGYDTTNNAMSGSFRTNFRKPEAPGDIIVFRKRDKGGDQGFGHVGIFINETSSAYTVLGGNQKNGKKYSSVNTTTTF